MLAPYPVVVPGGEWERLEGVAREAARQHPYGSSLLGPVLDYYYPRLRRFAQSYVGGPEHANDIVQTAMMNMYRALPTFRFESTFRSWLYRIVLNEIRRSAGRELRRQSQRDHFGPELIGTGSDPQDRLANRVTVERILLRLKARDADLLRLQYYDDLTIAEMADALEIGESAVKMRLKRARESFARLWNET